MRFNDKSSSIFGLYWSIGYFVGVIVNKLTYTVLIITSILLLHSSKVGGNFSNNVENVLDTMLSPYVFAEKIVVETVNLVKSIGCPKKNEHLNTE